MKIILEETDRQTIETNRKKIDSGADGYFMAKPSGGHQSIIFRVVDRAKAENLMVQLFMTMGRTSEASKEFTEATGIEITQINIHAITTEQTILFEQDIERCVEKLVHGEYSIGGSKDDSNQK